MPVDLANINIIAPSDAKTIALDSMIKPLRNYGGLTKTHALLASSPARNAAKVDLCPESDQRGKPRDKAFLLPIIAANKNIAVIDLGGNCDIGAVEYSAGD